MSRAAGLGVIVGALAAAAAGQPAPLTTPPPLVTAVELRSDAPLEDVEELASLVAVRPGEPLSEDGVRRTLRNIQAAGVASEVALYTQPADGGVVAVVALWAHVRVEDVRIEGQLGMRAEELRRSLTVRAGEPLIEDRVLRSVYHLQDRYRAEGYFQATVRVQVSTDPARKRATVVFAVDSGARAQIGAVEFAGDVAPLTPAELRQPLRSQPGSNYGAGRVRDDAERLHAFLVRRGYRLAVVEPARESPDAPGRVDLTFPVTLGPLVEVRVVGAELDQLRKRDLLPFLADEGYDEALVLQAVDRIRRHYQERGHYRVRVERREERQEDRLLLTLEIEPGPVYELEEVNFAGNEQVPDERLAGLMTTKPRRLLRPGSGRLVDEVLDEDLANLQSFYALEGYGEARVGPEEVEQPDSILLLSIPVLEGKRTTVSELTFEGVEHLDLDEVRAQLLLHAGGPFHPLLLEDSLNVLRSLYENEGYETAQISPLLEWNQDRTEVKIALLVFEGPQSRVDRIVLRGNLATEGKVLRRVIDLTPGEPVSRRRLLEAQRQLYRLGIFSRVEVELTRGDSEGRRDVVVRVEEGKARRVRYGVGYDSEDGARGLLGFSHSNLLGRALAFQADVRASQRDELARALFRQPYLFRWPVPVVYTAFLAAEERESFDSRRRGTQVEAERILGRTRLGLLYTYKIVDLQVQDPTLAGGDIQRELQDVEISSLTPSVLIDRRDDPIDPTRGWSTAFLIEWAEPLLAADEAFLKFFLQGTYQLDLERGGVLAASLRLGAIEARPDPGPPDPTLPPAFETAEIPISERFFAGGRTTHRAYKRDFLGLRGRTLCGPEPAPGETPTCPAVAATDDDLLPVGGDGLALLNLDYRFPIAGPVGGILFVDSGNVWTRWQDVDPGEAKTGAGVGVRYLSAVGPLRLEVGWKLDREPGEDPYVVFLSFGNPF